MKLKKARNCFTFESGSTAMGNEENATTFILSELWTYCKDLIAMIKEPLAWSSFATELEAIKTLKIYFTDFEIYHILRAQNGISDSLAKIARSFYRVLYYIDCFILVWVDHAPQV